jgi:hypothetical protein
MAAELGLLPGHLGSPVLHDFHVLRAHILRELRAGGARQQVGCALRSVARQGPCGALRKRSSFSVPYDLVVVWGCEALPAS